MHYPARAEMCPHACKLALSQITVQILAIRHTDIHLSKTKMGLPARDFKVLTSWSLVTATKNKLLNQTNYKLFT